MPDGYSITTSRNEELQPVCLSGYHAFGSGCRQTWHWGKSDVLETWALSHCADHQGRVSS